MHNLAIYLRRFLVTGSTLLIAVLATYLYQLALRWNPILLLSLFLPLCFGFAMAVIGLRITATLQTKSTVVALLIGLTVGLLGVYGKHRMQYEHDLSVIATDYADDNQTPAELKFEIRRQLPLIPYLKERSEIGFQISRRGRGIPISGWAIYAFWTVEAGIICVCTSAGSIAGTEM